MSKISQTKAGVALSYLMLMVSNVLSIILVPIILGALGTEETGIYEAIGSMAGIMVVLDFGLGSTVTRYVAKYRAEGKIKEEENFLASTLILYSIIAVLVVIIGYAMSFFLDVMFTKTFTIDDIKIARTMFIILVINVAVNLPLNSFSAVMNGREQFVLPRLLGILRVIIRFVVIVLLLNLGYRAIMIVVVDTILNIIIQLIIMAYAIFKLKVKIKLHKWDKGFIKEISTFSLIIFMTMVYDQIFWKVDQIIVGMMISKTAITVCSYGVRINVYYMRFSTAISEVFLPRATKMITQGATGKDLTDFMIRIGRIQMLILSLILCGVAVFGRMFFTLWVGGQMGELSDISWKICMIVMIPLTVPLVQNIGISILRAMNKHAFRSKVYLVIALVNIFVTWLLIKYIGILGAPIATAIALTLGNIIIINIYYSKEIGIEVLRFFKKTFLSFSPLIAIMLVLGFAIERYALAETWTSLILWIAGFSVVYFILARLFIMNDSEKDLLSRTFARIKNFAKR